MSFFDHFTSLDTTRWTSLTSGTGTVTSNDSRLLCNVPANNDAAAAYYVTKLSKSKSQLWVFDIEFISAINWGIQIINKATAPIVDTNANYDAIQLLRVSTGLIASVRHLIFEYYDSGAVRTRWDLGALAWATGGPDPDMPHAFSDYNRVFIEFDAEGTNSRWRMGTIHLRIDAANDQSYKLLTVTNWVNWSATRAGTDLWLVLGWPWNDIAQAGEFHVETARLADSSREHAWVNSRNDSGTWKIYHHWSYDGAFFTPENNSDTPAVDVGGAGAWDEQYTKDRTVLLDAGTYNMLYAGARVSDGKFQIGLATASNPNGPWTKDAGNPLIDLSAGVESQVFAPYLVKENSDATNPWKLLYAAYDGTNWRIRFRQAATLAALDVATASTVLGPGGAGDFDELGCSNPVAINVGGIWEVWYAGKATGAGSRWSVGRSTGSVLSALAKDGAGARIPNEADAVEDISSNPTTDNHIFPMASTTGFVVDGLVCIDDDVTGANFVVDRIRKVNANVSLEMVHQAAGFTISPQTRVAQYNRGGGETIHAILQRSGEWWFYTSSFNFFVADANQLASLEHMALWTHASATPAGGTPAVSWIHTPQIPINVWNGAASMENISLVNVPVTVSAGPYQVLYGPRMPRFA